MMDHLASAISVSSEEALVAELRAGSEEAFAELIAQYHQPLYSLIARSLQDPADASDITQEVFIKVFRNIRTFHGDASLRTWLYRIALHEASNQRRWWSRHKRQEVAMDAPCCARCDMESESEAQSLGDTMADGGCSPFDFASQEEVKARVEAALREVPEVFRTVVVLREIEGFAYEEIAEILQVNLGTVKSRLTRGRGALRALLAPDTNDATCPQASSTYGATVTTCDRIARPVSADLQVVSSALPLDAALKVPIKVPIIMPIDAPIDGVRQPTHSGLGQAGGADSLAEVSR